MTRDEIRSVLQSCVSPSAVARVRFFLRDYDEFFFPLRVSERLFLGIAERDFQLDGFTVRRLADIEEAEPIRGTYLKIHQAEGNLARLSVPPIPITSWRAACSALAASGELVIVETEEETADGFFIGRILAVGEQGIRFRSFDGRGVWDERPIQLPYQRVKALTFGSRYITTYGKYVRPYPELVKRPPQA